MYVALSIESQYEVRSSHVAIAVVITQLKSRPLFKCNLRCIKTRYSNSSRFLTSRTFRPSEPCRDLFMRWAVHLTMRCSCPSFSFMGKSMLKVYWQYVSSISVTNGGAKFHSSEYYSAFGLWFCCNCNFLKPSSRPVTKLKNCSVQQRAKLSWTFDSSLFSRSLLRCHTMPLRTVENAAALRSMTNHLTSLSSVPNSSKTETMSQLFCNINRHDTV